MKVRVTIGMWEMAEEGVGWDVGWVLTLNVKVREIDLS